MTKIENIILELFNHNRIVFFYDTERQFQEEIDDLNLDNIIIHKLTDSNWFKTKYLLEIEDTINNYLIYAPFSRPDDKNNNLADTIYYSKEFHADRISMILEELKLSNEFKPLFTKYKNFFNATSRVDKFKEFLEDHEKNENSIIISILSTIANISIANFDEVLKEVLTEDLKNNKYINNFKNFNILDEFWRLIQENYSYIDENPSVKKFLTKLLITYSYTQLKSNPPKAWEKLVLSNKGNVKVFINNLMNNSSRKSRGVTFQEKYDIISNEIAKEIKLASQISKKPVESFYSCDAFEIFDEKIIEHLADVLYDTQEYNSEITQITNDRVTTHFYKIFEDEYKAIKWANFLIKNINLFENEFEYDNPENIIKKYVKSENEHGWFFVDKSYRKFNYYFDMIKNPEKFHDLRQLVENMYTNTFLSKLSILWSENFNEYKSLNHMKQYEFYRKIVRNHCQKHKTVVLISDALRYGVCDELKDELDSDPRKETELETMISVLPSNTKFGMGALLPHNKMEFIDDKLLIDGMPSQSTENRKKILEKYEKDFDYKKSTAVKFNEISKLKKDELKEQFKEYHLIYIYHNKIDAIGDKLETENEVFKASQETIFEIKDFIDDLANYLNVKHVIITGDHGFIYKKDKINESDKVDLNVEVLEKHKRYLLSNEELYLSGTKTYELPFIETNLYVTVPKGADIFKTPGPGLNYVHGGASLQEMIVPILLVKSEKGSKEKNQDPVNLTLISPISRKITNLVSPLTFAQNENISDTKTPLEAKIYFINGFGDKISNELIIHANKNVETPQEREFKEKITFRDMKYDKKDKYYLIIENMENDSEIQRYEFILDLAFADGIEF